MKYQLNQRQYKPSFFAKFSLAVVSFIIGGTIGTFAAAYAINLDIAHNAPLPVYSTQQLQDAASSDILQPAAGSSVLGTPVGSAQLQPAVGASYLQPASGANSLQ